MVCKTAANMVLNLKSFKVWCGVGVVSMQGQMEAWRIHDGAVLFCSLSFFCGIPAAAEKTVAVGAVQLLDWLSLQAGLPCEPVAPASPALLGREPPQLLPLPRSLAQQHWLAAAEHKLFFCV